MLSLCRLSARPANPLRHEPGTLAAGRMHVPVAIANTATVFAPGKPVKRPATLRSYFTRDEGVSMQAEGIAYTVGCPATDRCAEQAGALKLGHSEQQGLNRSDILARQA